MRLLFDSTYSLVDESWFKSYSWFDYYRDAKEAIPGNMPEPRVNDRILLRLVRSALNIVCIVSCS